MEIQNKKLITLDLRQNTVIPLPQFIQNDTNTIEFDIKDNGVEADMTNIGKIVVNYKRSDNIVISRILEVVSGNVLYTIGLEEMEKAGYGELEIQFFSVDNTTRISTKRMKVYMIPSIGTDQIYESSEDYTALQELFIEVDTLRTDVQAAEDTRQSNEQTRQSQETDRQTNTSNAIDNLNSEVNKLKLNYLTPVTTFTDIATTYLSPTLGDSVQTTDDGKFYRWNGTEWKFTTLISNNAITDIQNKLSLQDQQTQALQHGLQVLNSDQASPLKVEFYGNHLVNLLGSGYSVEKEFLNADGSTTLIKSYDRDFDDSYYLFAIDVKTSSNGEVSFFEKIGGSPTNKKNFTVGTDYKTIYFVVNNSDVESVWFTEGSYSGDIYYKNERLYKITSEQSNKIGVSLTDADVERLFPYVDGIQGVKNPVLTVEGANLIGGFSTWDKLHENVTVISSYEIELNATGNYQQSYIEREVIVGQTYYFRGKGTGTYDINFYDVNKTYISKPLKQVQSGSFTVPSGVKYARVYADNYTTTGKFTFSNPILSLSDIPFVEKNDSYLYAETTLYGNNDKKDILYKNYDLNRWEKLRWFEYDVVLDGSLGWGFVQDHSGFKRVYVPLSEFTNNYTNNTQTLVKYDGSIIKNETLLSELTSADEIVMNSSQSSSMQLTISDTDSGWTDAMTPTAKMIKGYFYGWKYTGDGTTHSWVSIVDGSSAPTQTEDYVSANQAPSFENYFLLYQLQDSVVEPVTVEGDLSIQGDAQVEVGEGVQWREPITPKLYNGYYRINWDSDAETLTNHRTTNILTVFKNDEPDNTVLFSQGSSYFRDKYGASIPENDFDTNGNYSVSYEPLNKYDITTNLNEVVAHYNNSMKSSIYSMVAKQSDMATSVSILDRQVYKMLLALKDNGINV